MARGEHVNKGPLQSVPRYLLSAYDFFCGQGISGVCVVLRVELLRALLDCACNGASMRSTVLPFSLCHAGAGVAGMFLTEGQLNGR